MGPLDALWHALNFVAPALGVAAIAAAAAKLLWRRDLAGVGWLRLASWGTLAGVACLIGGLVAFGRDGGEAQMIPSAGLQLTVDEGSVVRDGAMATYGALALAIALALWWAGFVRR